MKGFRCVLEGAARRLASLLIVLLYLALLVGRAGLGRAYGPVLVLLASGLTGLGFHRVWRRHDFASSLRASFPELTLAAVLLLALGLRLLRLPQETPAAGTDERHFVESALAIIQTGKFIPASLRHPPLLVYGQMGVSVMRFLAGASRGLWTWPTELDPQHLYGWGRGLVVLLGTAALLPAYRIGERLHGRRSGLLAALLLALVPAHVVASGTITPEVPAALLALLTVWCSLRLEEHTRTSGKGALRWAFAAGACAGLTAGTHYAAALVLLVPLFAAARPRPTSSFLRGPSLLLVLTGGLCGFAAACPAALFDLGRLSAGLSEAVRVRFSPQAGVTFGLRQLLQEGLGYGPALLALLGAGLTLLRFRWQDGAVLLFPAASSLAILLVRQRFAHDLVPLAPWVALLAALSVDRLATWVGKRWPNRPGLDRWLFPALALSAGLVFLLAL